VTKFSKDEVIYAEVDEGVTPAVVLDHAPSQGWNNQEEDSNWTRTPLRAGVTTE
jgi:hypothetical protein